MDTNKDNHTVTPVGIIVAMGSELKMLLAEMDAISEETVNATTFYRGTISGRDIVAMQCGIGKVNAAVGALTLIERYKPAAIINTGIAGGTGKEAGVLDVVIGKEVAYHDVWCGPGNAPGQVQGLPERFAGATAFFGINEDTPGVKLGLIASGDRFISTPEELETLLATQPEAIACDMESGAIAQVCHLKQVPFLAIRVVSDTPGAENHIDQYLDFWNIAPTRTFAILRQLVTEGK